MRHLVTTFDHRVDTIDLFSFLAADLQLSDTSDEDE